VPLIAAIQGHRHLNITCSDSTEKKQYYEFITHTQLETCGKVSLAVWRSGSVVRRMNEVTLR